MKKKYIEEWLRGGQRQKRNLISRVSPLFLYEKTTQMKWGRAILRKGGVFPPFILRGCTPLQFIVAKIIEW